MALILCWRLRLTLGYSRLFLSQSPGKHPVLHTSQPPPALETSSQQGHGCVKAHCVTLVALVLFQYSVLVNRAVDQAGDFVVTGNRVSQMDRALCQEDLALLLPSLTTIIILRSPKRVNTKHPLTRLVSSLVLVSLVLIAALLSRRVPVVLLFPCAHPQVRKQQQPLQ